MMFLCLHVCHPPVNLMQLLMIKAEVSQTISKVWEVKGLCWRICVELLAQSLDVEGLVLKT